MVFRGYGGHVWRIIIIGAKVNRVAGGAAPAPLRPDGLGRPVEAKVLGCLLYDYQA